FRMRRFIAYLLAVITIFLGIGIAFKPAVTSINADLDFREGRQITFRLSNKDSESGELTPIASEDADTVKNYADVMETRLKGFGVSDYQIVTSGNDTVKVTLTTSSEEECNNVSKLLCTNPEIEVCNLTKDSEKEEEKIVEHPIKDDKDGKYSWHDNKAYLTYSGSSTILIMPIPADAKKAAEEMFDAAKKYEGEEPKPENNPSNEGEDEPKQSIILWMDRKEDDFYEDKDKNPNVANKVIYDQFNTSNFYYNDNKDSFQITFTPAGSDVTSIKEAYNKANLMLNLLNASETNVGCVAIHTEIIAPNVESLLVYGTRVNIAISATLISLIIGFIIISLILTLFYRLSALAIISTMSVHTFLTFTIFTLFKATFNIAAMVGLIVVALSALASSIAHNSYLHEEVYKGRSLKKANFEASKKTTMLTVDISVIFAVLGVILYFLGGTSASSAGAILVISAVFNILINTFLLKGLMWLLTNNTNYQNKEKYKLLNIDASKVPDLSKEEKPTYYGPFANKDYSKKKKVSGIVTLVLTLASVAGLIAFGVTNKLFNTSNYYASTNEITFSIVVDDSSASHPSIDDEIVPSLNEIKCNDQALRYNKDGITYFQYEVIDDSDDKSNPEKFYYQTYRVEVLESDLLSPIYSYEEGGSKNSLKDVLGSVLAKYNVKDENIRTYTNAIYNVPNNAAIIFAATLLSSLVTSVYLLIRRFRASRVLSLFITTSVGTILTVGFISLTRLVATPIMSVATMLTMVATTLMALFVMHKDKQLIHEERLRDVATRKEVLKKANSLALLPTLIFGLVSIYAAINFFGFGHKEYLAIFLSAAFGTVMSLIILVTWFTTMCNFFDERFARVRLPQIRRHKKTTIKIKSNEPEEAIFIGIND
ncbi:MAG: hypothetical protein MJ208_03885, partial [Bacilli bacterium]|nr:hypothetical protein [Bacilli bacterium]